MLVTKGCLRACREQAARTERRECHLNCAWASAGGSNRPCSPAQIKSRHHSCRSTLLPMLVRVELLVISGVAPRSLSHLSWNRHSAHHFICILISLVFEFSYRVRVESVPRAWTQTLPCDCFWVLLGTNLSGRPDSESAREHGTMRWHCVIAPFDVRVSGIGACHEHVTVRGTDHCIEGA